MANSERIPIATESLIRESIFTNAGDKDSLFDQL